MMRFHFIRKIISFNITMNITSSVPLNVQSTVENLHKMYVQTRDQQVDGKKVKFKSKIRVKSKSQGKFVIEPDRENNTQKIGKTINFVNILKEVKTVSKEQLKRNIILPQEYKLFTPQRQLIFLKELVNRRKMAVQCDPMKVNRSQSQSQLSEILLPKQKYQSTMPLKPQSKLQNKGWVEQSDLGMPLWEKKIDQYQHYDSIVKNLLCQINTKRSQGKSNRPTISPNKYCQAKQKLIAKMQQDMSRTEATFCNFKATIKIHPKKDSMIFRMNDNISDTVYEKKITSYVKFLYKINFSNCIYNDLSLSNQGKIYKVKIGGGNNSELIKMLIKRRFWLQIDNSLQVSQNKEENKISFIWTQSTNQNSHKMQESNNSTDESGKRLEQIQKFSKKLKKIRKLQKKNQSFMNNQKILHSLDIEEAQSHYYASNNGVFSVYQKAEQKIITNHIPSNYIIGSKKALFLLLHWYYKNIMQIDPFTYMPKTYHIRSGDVNNPVFLGFLKNESSKPGQVWIVKPGQNTNRGNGINVASFNQVARLIRKKQTHKNGDQKTYIIQEYLKPFLYQSRKFDIRHYLLITSVKGNMKAYWFKQGYIRTSSQKYDIDDLGNQFIHLTNDAIQKKSDLYGKYEPGNKLSYSSFQRYLDQTYPQKKYSFQNQILKKMKQITTDLIHASFSYLDPNRNNSNFELYGMDFMINSKFQPYLIQVNANPCLQISCPVLQRIIPILVQHTFRLALDPLLPPPQHFPINQRYQLSDRILEKLKYQLIFDQKNQGNQIRQKINACQNKFVLSSKEMQPDEQIFDNDGEDVKNFVID